MLPVYHVCVMCVYVNPYIPTETHTEKSEITWTFKKLAVNDLNFRISLTVDRNCFKAIFCITDHHFLATFSYLANQDNSTAGKKSRDCNSSISPQGTSLLTSSNKKIWRLVQTYFISSHTQNGLSQAKCDNAVPYCKSGHSIVPINNQYSHGISTTMLSTNTTHSRICTNISVETLRFVRVMSLFWKFSIYTASAYGSAKQRKIALQNTSKTIIYSCTNISGDTPFCQGHITLFDRFQFDG